MHMISLVTLSLYSVPDPDLSDEIGEESSATWVELLGDVFYVGWLRYKPPLYFSFIQILTLFIVTLLMQQRSPVQMVLENTLLGLSSCGGLGVLVLCKLTRDKPFGWSDIICRYSSRYDSGDVTHHVYKIIELCGLGKVSFLKKKMKESYVYF